MHQRQNVITVYHFLTVEQNTHWQKSETDIPEVDRQVLVLNGTAQVLDTLKVKLLRVFLTNKNIKSIIYK